MSVTQQMTLWITFKVLTVVLLGCCRFGYSGPISYTTFNVMEGNTVELPCEFNMTTIEEDVTLVLWHRDDSGSPVYSVDARRRGLSAARHFPSKEVAHRSHFNLTSSPFIFRVEEVKKSDEGLYRCRVEYKRSRTETTDIMLNVIVAPREAIIMDEYGQHLRGVIGPYNEGFPLTLACEGEGGDPSPSVRWWRDAELLDDSYYITPQGFARNELLLSSLKRTDLMSRLTCQVSNSNLTAPVMSFVVIDLNLKPIEVQLRTTFRPLSAGQVVEVVCIARGARPPAQISWWLDGEKLTSRVTESTSRDENLTVSSLLFTPGRHDNQRNLSCRGDNPQLPDSVLEDTWVLEIHFPPELTVKVSKQPPVSEGSEISMMCVARANPPIGELEWLRNGQSLGPPKKMDSSNGTFYIPSLDPGHAGKYQCVASNSEGKSFSKLFLLNLQYAPRCRHLSGRVYGVGHTESVSVTCEVDASPEDVSFSWTFGDTLSPDQYTTNGTQSIAMISPASPQEFGDLFCYATNTVGRQKEPCRFRIVPAGPPEEPQNCAITNRTDHCIEVLCSSGQDGGLQQLFTLEIFSTDSDSLLANLSSKEIPRFSVCSLPTSESLVLVVYALNSKGRSRQVAMHATGFDSSHLKDGADDDSGTLVAVLGVAVGAITVLLISALVVLITIKINSKRHNTKDNHSLDHKKDDYHPTKDCKEPCVASSQGPDIIPDKSYFQDLSDSMPHVIEVEQGVNPSLAQSDPMCHTYTTFQGDIKATRKLQMSQESEIETLDPSFSETPLISSINPILQVTRI